MIDDKQITDYITSLPGVSLDKPFAKNLLVYQCADQMFALLTEDSRPLKLSLRCDPQLSELLRQKYETVMPGEKLNINQWNTLLLTGQLKWPEVRDLIRHAYELVKNN